MTEVQFIEEAIGRARIGRTGWKALALAEAKLAWKAKVAGEKAAARAVRNARADADRLAKAAKEKAARAAADAAIDAEAETAGYGLRDVNPNYFQCGHYPDWVVVAGGKYASREEAEAAKVSKNSASTADWLAFLNG
jgi:hypothetical protein